MGHDMPSKARSLRLIKFYFSMDFLYVLSFDTYSEPKTRID